MEEKTYTLDELKSEVDKFREYLFGVCYKQNIKIDVEFNFMPNKEFREISRGNVESEIFIRNNKDW